MCFFQPALFFKARNVELVHTSASASEVANYGADTPGRYIVVLAVGGNSAAAYNIAATISGVAATIIKRHTSGDGVATATGTAILVGQPTGTSGTVTITGAPAGARFYVLRVIGYNMAAAVASDDSAGVGIPPWTINVPADGLCLAIIQNSNLNAIAWTGLTEQVQENALITSKNSSVAWDKTLPANAALPVGVTGGSDANGVTSAVIATFSPN